jgi:hypothetical protein
MILTLAVLGMVLGSFAVVQPVMAAGPCTDIIDGGYGCDVVICGECIIVLCGGPPQNPCGPIITP